MHFVPHTEADRRAMLAMIGAPSVDALFEACIPPDCRHDKLLEVEPALINERANLNKDLEIDSIDAIDLILKLKDFTGRKIRPEEFKHVRTVGDVVATVQAIVSA